MSWAHHDKRTIPDNRSVPKAICSGSLELCRCRNTPDRRPAPLIQTENEPMTRHDKTRIGAALPIDRRNALKMAGAGAVALGVMALANPATAWAQDLSHGADNFYVSDSVTVQPITFQTQYRTT